MATTKVRRITTTLSKALAYIENPKKTDGTILVSGFACSPEIAHIQFDQAKKNASKRDGTLAFHLIQSFSPGEVDYKTAHKIGVELADKILKGRFQYVVATHTDRGHLHNHIIFNSVSFKDKTKYHSTASTYRFIRRQSDLLCTEYGLSVIEQPQEKGKTHYEHSIDKQGKSWKSLLRQNIDKCILQAKDWDEFLMLMQREKYEIKQGKYISFRANGQERFTRSKTLGENYTEENIRNRILGYARKLSGNKPDVGRNLIIDIENSIKSQQSKGYANWAKGFNLKLAAQTLNYLTEHNLLDRNVLDEKISSLSENYSSSRSRLKDVEKQIKTIEEQIHDIDAYRKNKPIADKLQTIVFKEKFKKEHESELILFNAAEKACKKHFGKNKFPLIKDLRAKQKELFHEKEQLKTAVNATKPGLDELTNVRKNIDMFLGINAHKDTTKQKHSTNILE